MPDYPLPSSNPQALGFALKPLEHLDHLIRAHIEEGRYPGAQIALARNGQLALSRCYGDARTGGQRVPATADTLFLLSSQTKVLTSSAVWALVEEGRLSFMDKISDQLPEFARRGKADITLHQVMTHQGGFPSGDITPATWSDHARMRAEVCDFSLDWIHGTRPGSTASPLWCTPRSTEGELSKPPPSRAYRAGPSLLHLRRRALRGGYLGETPSSACGRG